MQRTAEVLIRRRRQRPSDHQKQHSEPMTQPDEDRPATDEELPDRGEGEGEPRPTMAGEKRDTAPQSTEQTIEAGSRAEDRRDPQPERPSSAE